MEIGDIKIGYKIPIKKIHNGKEEILKAEVLSKRDSSGNFLFYVHYVDLNRRLDEWVKGSSFILDNLANIEIPKKRKKYESVKLKEKKKNNTEENPKKKTLENEEEYKIKNIRKIMFRDYLVEPWYFSPYPKSIAESEIVYICEYCLFYFGAKSNFIDHSKICDLRHPPGFEIYRHDGLSFFEVDGYKEKQYCRNLSLLSKLFLDHKSLYYDIDVFLFYVLCRVVDGKYTVVGYFSKEKISEQGYNLACILTLPFEQRKGYGRVLIDFSYMLSKKENIISGPEKPLSDLGLLSYRTYWKEVIIEYLLSKKFISIEEISKDTHITVEDIIGTLQHFKILALYKGRFVFAISEEQKLKAAKLKSKWLDEKYLKLY